MAIRWAASISSCTRSTRELQSHLGPYTCATLRKGSGTDDEFLPSLVLMAPWSMMIALAAAAAIVTALALNARRRGAPLRAASASRSSRWRSPAPVAGAGGSSAVQRRGGGGARRQRPSLGPRPAQGADRRRAREAAGGARRARRYRDARDRGGGRAPRRRNADFRRPRQRPVGCFRPSASAWFSSSPTGRFTTFPPTPGRLASRRRCMRSSPAARASATAASNSSRRRVFGLVGKDQMVQLRVVESGGSGAPAPLRVLRDGKEIARVTARPGDRISRARAHRARRAECRRLEAAALADELTLVNNKAVLTIEGVRDKSRCCSSQASRTPASAPGATCSNPTPMSNGGFHLRRLAGEAGRTCHFGTVADRLPSSADLFRAKIASFHLIVFDRYSNHSGAAMLTSTISSAMCATAARRPPPPVLITASATVCFICPSAAWRGRGRPVSYRTAIPRPRLRRGEKHPVTRALPEL